MGTKMCSKCGQKPIRRNGCYRCIDCDRQYYREFYSRRKQLGLCIKCHNENLTNGLLCQQCADKQKRRQNDRRHNRKKEFLCVACGADIDGIHTECDDCISKRKSKYHRKRDGFSCNGVCSQCGNNRPMPGLKSCSKCLERARQWYHQNTKKTRTEDRKAVKTVVFKAYGDKCACCGEDNPLFLTVDHVNNNGNNHRKRLGTTERIYKEIIKLKFPNEFQLLCWNCNMGKSLNNGICPHCGV